MDKFTKSFYQEQTVMVHLLVTIELQWFSARVRIIHELQFDMLPPPLSLCHTEAHMTFSKNITEFHPHLVYAPVFLSRLVSLCSAAGLDQKAKGIVASAQFLAAEYSSAT